MSTYKQIAGTTVKAYTTNPSDPQEGEMWYNQTTLKLRGVTALAAWSSTAPLIADRDKPGAAGIQTAILAIGGEPGLSSVDEYNGSGWTSAPAINAGRDGMASGGTTSAAWKAGGNPPSTTTATEEYDGSSWTTVPGTLNTGRYIMGSCGTQTAGLCNGGYNTANVNNSEEYNGTTWSEGNNLNTARRTPTDIGVQTAAVAFGGQPPPGPVSNDVEEYDGTSWTTVGNYPTNIADSAGSGTLTAGLAFGGNVPPSTTATKNYDGTTWTASPATLGTAAKRHGGTPSGTDSAAVAFGGDGPGSNTNISQEFNFSAQVVTAGAWASAPTLPESRYTNAGAGTVTAALNWGGVFPTSSTTAEYNGSSWSTGGAYPYAIANHGGTGLQTAALSVGGLNPGSPPAKTDTFEYDGSSWGNPATYPQQGFGVRVWGIQTSAVATGGGAYPAPTYNTTTANSYNGTSWTSETAFSTLRSFHSTGGANDTAGIIVGGRSAPGTETAIDDTEEYDGTSWTAGGDYITVVKECTGWGVQTDQMQAGGSVPSYTTTCAIYNGTAWATTASLPTVLANNATTQGTFNTNSGFVMGGTAPSATNAVSEFTPESTSLNTVDITTAE